MMSRAHALVLVALAGFLSGCAEGTTRPDPAVPTAGSGLSKPGEQAPDEYHVRLDTSRGEVIIEVLREWAPHGADRFYELVKSGYYDDCRFFRVVSGFMVQCGMHGDPKTNAKWADANIPDDPVRTTNKRGFVTFAMRGPNTRTTQFFINLVDNGQGLDPQGFAPFGKVIQGMEVVDSLYSRYGDGPPSGYGPEQGRIRAEGNAYLNREYPRLDYIKKAEIVKMEKKEGADEKAEEKAGGSEAKSAAPEEKAAPEKSE